MSTADLLKILLLLKQATLYGRNFTMYSLPAVLADAKAVMGIWKGLCCILQF